MFFRVKETHLFCDFMRLDSYYRVDVISTPAFLEEELPE